MDEANRAMVLIGMPGEYVPGTAMSTSLISARVGATNFKGIEFMESISAFIASLSSLMSFHIVSQCFFVLDTKKNRKICSTLRILSAYTRLKRRSASQFSILSLAMFASKTASLDDEKPDRQSGHFYHIDRVLLRSKTREISIELSCRKPRDAILWIPRGFTISIVCWRRRKSRN